MLISAGMDGTARIWDVKTQKNALAIPAHPQEVLTCDFSKYEDIVATGSGDNSIRLWDLRQVARPIAVFPAHRYAVKQVRFSPWTANHLLSAS
jgi:WD40 repeat protein